MSLGPGNLIMFKEYVLPLLTRRKKVISLGYPEIRNGLVKEIFNFESKTFLDFAHGLGFEEAIVIDFSNKVPCDIVQDLNYQVEDTRLLDADLILDPGTMEHCFNVAQAFKNIKDMLSIGGVIWNNNPANWIDHGFYNFCPGFYYDFYKANGFGNISVFLRGKDTGPLGQRQPDQSKRRVLSTYRYIYNTVAVKQKEVQYQMPIQSRYASSK